MVTTPLEYYSNLNLVLNENPPIYALLPNAEKIYNIDLNTRIIDAPEFLGINKDHKAETIYFIVDRYNDYMDLSQTCCAITYINANKKGHQYMVPFYDIYTYAKEGKMLLPWNLDANVLESKGPVQFAIRFYKIGTSINDNGAAEKVLVYNLNTLPATSVVKEGMEVSKFENTSYLLTATQAEEIQSRIDEISAYQTLYWTVLD